MTDDLVCENDIPYRFCINPVPKININTAITTELPTQKSSQFFGEASTPIIISLLAFTVIFLVVVIFFYLKIKKQTSQIKELNKTVEMLNQVPVTTRPTAISLMEVSTTVHYPYRYSAQLFKTSKSDEKIEECADMACINQKDQIFSIADGVSQAFNSGRWSQLLVERVTPTCDISSLVTDISESVNLWENDCHLLLENEDPKSFIRQKQLEGSQSTLASLSLINRNGQLFWRFSTIGDSLLIVIDTSDGLSNAAKFIPFLKTDDFPSSPDVLSTKYPYLRGCIKTYEISANTEQKLLLMTDALARYAVQRRSAAEPIYEVFPFLTSSEIDFNNWIRETRNLGLADDDSTLIYISPSNE